MEKQYYLYKHTCPNGKVYIGITSQIPSKRWNNGKGYKLHNQHFYAAIEKFGWENIKHEILFDGLTKAEAEQKEIELIAQNKSNQREFGYNKSTGGEHSGSGAKRTPEQCKAISDRMQGRVLRDETKQKLRVALTGRKATVETRAKLSNARKGKKHSPEHIAHRVAALKGKKRNEEICKKFSEVQKGKATGDKNGRARAVNQFDKDGNFIACYACIKFAAQATGANAQSIKDNCRGRYKTAGGFVWRYANV